jgi:hypothetical protein
MAYAWAACLASDVSGDLETMRVPGLVIASMPICSGLCTPPYPRREIVAECFDVEVELVFWKASGHFPFFVRMLCNLTTKSRCTFGAIALTTYE